MHLEKLADVVPFVVATASANGGDGGKRNLPRLNLAKIGEAVIVVGAVLIGGYWALKGEIQALHLETERLNATLNVISDSVQANTEARLKGGRWTHTQHMNYQQGHDRAHVDLQQRLDRITEDLASIKGMLKGQQVANDRANNTK